MDGNINFDDINIKLEVLSEYDKPMSFLSWVYYYTDLTSRVRHNTHRQITQEQAIAFAKGLLNKPVYGITSEDDQVFFEKRKEALKKYLETLDIQILIAESILLDEEARAEVEDDRNSGR